MAAIERAVSPLVRAVEAASWPLIEAFGVDRFFGVHTAPPRSCWRTIVEAAEALTGLTGEKAARALTAHFPLACVKQGADGATLVAEAARSTAPEADR